MRFGMVAACGLSLLLLDVLPLTAQQRPLTCGQREHQIKSVQAEVTTLTVRAAGRKADCTAAAATRRAEACSAYGAALGLQREKEHQLETLTKDPAWQACGGVVRETDRVSSPAYGQGWGQSGSGGGFGAGQGGTGSAPGGSAANSSANRLLHVIPSRAFLGPHDVPPREFAAYGIVAFPQRSTPQTERRHIAICHAFLASLPDTSEINRPPSEQMVTVWPVESEIVVGELSRRTRGAICHEAVMRYHLPSALLALREAKTDNAVNLSGEGPYLLAWAPSSEKGKSSAIVLIYDLSNDVRPEQYAASFRAWRNDIERKPELWRHGWSLADLRNAIRNWADRWGSLFLSIGQAKE